MNLKRIEESEISLEKPCYSRMKMDVEKIPEKPYRLSWPLGNKSQNIRMFRNFSEKVLIFKDENVSRKDIHWGPYCWLFTLLGNEMQWYEPQNDRMIWNFPEIALVLKDENKSWKDIRWEPYRRLSSPLGNEPQNVRLIRKFFEKVLIFKDENGSSNDIS